MKFPEVEHIFFDLDHTLWDFDRNSGVAFSKILVGQEINLQIEEFLKVYMPINLKYWRLYRNNAVSKEELRKGRLQETFDFLKIKIAEAQILQIADDYIKYLPQSNYLVDGASEVLEYLEKKYQLHVITNGFQEVQFLKMKNSGIANFFRSITTSEEAGIKKPHSGIFNVAFQKAGASAKNSLMIGDSIEADILGAQQIGMAAIFFNYYNSDLPAQYQEIRSLLELKEML